MLTTQDINFPLYVRRQDLTKFLVRYELFKMAMHVHGHIVECGVGDGGGLLAWYHLSSIFEPYNHVRKILGYDTFSGFPVVSPKDGTHHTIGEQAFHSYDEIVRLAEYHDNNRPIGHIPKLELVKGNASETIPWYLKNNPHVLIAIAYMDFDIYQPTKTALELFLPRMPKGAIIAFDEACNANWPGETIALLESIDMRHLKLRRFSWQSTTSYAVL